MGGLTNNALRFGLKRKLTVVAVGIALLSLSSLLYEDASCRHPAKPGSGNRVVMGTSSRVIVIAPNENTAKRCFEAAFKVQQHIEALMGYHREDSGLSRVSHEAAEGKSQTPFMLPQKDLTLCDSRVQTSSTAGLMAEPPRVTGHGLARVFRRTAATALTMPTTGPTPIAKPTLRVFRARHTGPPPRRGSHTEQA